MAENLASLSRDVGERKIFLTSDLHLNHANIIEYCQRPFGDIKHMNDSLIENWNNTVGTRDLVYFLGDFALVNSRKELCSLIRILNGKKIFILGNHDEYVKAYHHFILNYKEQSFYLVHKPKDVPRNWPGWAIVGHTHNRDKFIDRDNRVVNVSVELTNYKPVGLSEIYQEIRQA